MPSLFFCVHIALYIIGPTKQDFLGSTSLFHISLNLLCNWFLSFKTFHVSSCIRWKGGSLSYLCIGQVLDCWLHSKAFNIWGGLLLNDNTHQSCMHQSLNLWPTRSSWLWGRLNFVIKSSLGFWELESKTHRTFHVLIPNLWRIRASYISQTH